MMVDSSSQLLELMIFNGNTRASSAVGGGTIHRVVRSVVPRKQRYW